MNALKTTAAALIVGGLLTASASPAEAGHRGSHNLGYALGGFAVGVIAGSAWNDCHRDYYCYDRPVYYRSYSYYSCPPPPVYRSSVVYYESSPRTVYVYDSAPVVYRTASEPVTYSAPAATTQPVVVQQNYAPAPESYTHYKETRVWPFYRKVDSETIPQVVNPNPGNSQAVSRADRYVVAQPAAQRAVDTQKATNEAGQSEAVPEKPAAESPVSYSPSTKSAPTRTVSNRVGQPQVKPRITEVRSTSAPASARVIPASNNRIVDVRPATSQAAETMPNNVSTSTATRSTWF